jgi:hypothetical protein
MRCAAMFQSGPGGMSIPELTLTSSAKDRRKRARVRPGWTRTSTAPATISMQDAASTPAARVPVQRLGDFPGHRM